MNELLNDQEKLQENLSNKEDFDTLENAINEEKQEIINLNKEITEIKEFLVLDKVEKEKEKEKLLKEEKLLEKENIQKEKVLEEEQVKSDLLLQEEQEKEKLKQQDNHNELVEILSTPQEFINYKEEITILNNNLVEIYAGSIVFIGLMVGILLSSFFLKGVYK